MSTTAGTKLPLHRRAGAHALREFRHVLPPTLFFAAGFCLIVATQRLLLNQYLAELAGFMVAITSALVVGKAVLVANKMPFLRIFDHAPLIHPILFKTVVYWAFVFLARFLERLVHYVLDEGGFTGFFADLDAHFAWNRFLFIQTWIFVLFLVYTTFSELNALLGDGELWKILFTRRSDELKRTRRQRVRALVRLNAVLRGTSTAALRDPATPAHGEAIAILESLARDAR